MYKKMGYLILVLSLLTVGLGGFAADYADALQKSIWFYDANKCGPDAGTNNVFSSWRGACHTKDGYDVGVDCTGGYHDAGDHVKFGLPQGYAASVLGWALYEFKSQFDATGNTTKLLSTLKYFTDYFLRCHPSSGKFYYQLGDGDVDHQYWGSPELQTEDRPTLFYADASHPASDICGITAGALALMYLNYRNVDSAYASRCLTAAKSLYALGKANINYGSGQSFYQSSSMYDDLSWAALWLYVIEGNASYITEIDQFLTNPTKNGDVPFKQNHWTMCWDDMHLAVLTKLTMLTGNTKYSNVVDENLNYWMNSLTTTPGGLKYLNNWGVLRYAAAESMIALIYHGYTKNRTYYDFAMSQINYILGSNPAGHAYMIGIGGWQCDHVHHRAANGWQGYANNANANPALNELTGALVGGPGNNDVFVDSVYEYQYTEVAIDYNAGLVGALAGAVRGVVTGTTPTPTPTPTGGSRGDANGNGAVDINDALVIARYSAGLNPSPFNAAQADANCDSQVNINDALVVARYSAGLTAAPACN